MNGKTYDLLQSAITLWQKHAEARAPDDVKIREIDNDLCRQFAFHDRPCVGCPVSAVMHNKYCIGTGYGDAWKALTRWNHFGGGENNWEGHVFRAAALKHVEFLQALVPAGGPEDNT